MAFLFEDLDVYQNAVDFTDPIAALTEGFPRGYSFLTDQLNRAALSIATILAEGNGDSPKPAAGTSSRLHGARCRNVCPCSRLRGVAVSSTKPGIARCATSLRSWPT